MAHGSPPKGLAAKVLLQAEAQDSRTKFPELLLPLAKAVLDPALSGSLAEELPFHPYASPFLQSLLMAQSSDRSASHTPLWSMGGHLNVDNALMRHH